MGSSKVLCPIFSYLAQFFWGVNFRVMEVEACRLDLESLDENTLSPQLNMTSYRCNFVLSYLDPM